MGHNKTAWMRFKDGCGPGHCAHDEGLAALNIFFCETWETSASMSNHLVVYHTKLLMWWPPYCDCIIHSVMFCEEMGGGGMQFRKRYDNSTVWLNWYFLTGIVKKLVSFFYWMTITFFYCFEDMTAVFGGFSNEFIPVNLGCSCDISYE